MWRRVALTALTLALVTSHADAAVELPRIHGRIVDEVGRPVAGASITARAPGQFRRTTASKEGKYLLDAIPPSTYTVTIAAVGFRTESHTVDVQRGLPSRLDVTLAAGASQTITVLGEEPLIDVGKSVTGTEIHLLDLEGLPTTRDPWAVLRSAPGILTDRVNVGGNETVDHARLVSNGTTSDQATFSIDGTPVTDMVDTGLPPTFFDFDSFDSIAVITGGSDPRISTSGVQMRMTVKRGRDHWRGGGRWLFSNRALQSGGERAAEDPAWSPSSIRRIDDTGVEAGGPVVGDRAWIWTAIAHRSFSLAPARADTGYGTSFGDSAFATADAKLNYQFTPGYDGTALVMIGDHRREAIGLSALRAPETSWNEGIRSALFRIEQSALVSPSAIIVATASAASYSIERDPAGGRGVPMYLDASGTARRSYMFSDSERPQRSAGLSATLFTRRLGADHELRAGGDYRSVDVDESFGYPATGNYGVFEFPSGGTAVLSRSAHPRFATNYRSLWAGDTITARRVTALIGLRMDLQRGRLLASSVAENPDFPDLLPAATFAGDVGRVFWRDFSPRVGLTFAVDQDKRTLLRAAYNRYADQLSARDLSTMHPLSDTQERYYSWVDDNGDRIVQRSELLDFYGWYNLDPSDPASAPILRRIEPSLKNPYVDEWTIGAERQFGRSFVASMNATRRTRRRLLGIAYERTPGVGDFYLQDDYEYAGTISGRLPDGTAYERPYYRLRERFDGAYPVITNRPDYAQEYRGLDLSLLRRFNGRWMLRASVTLNDWHQSLGEGAITDPTPLLGPYGCSSCRDAIVVQGPDQRMTPKESVFINARWAYSISTLVQLSRGFAASATVYGREGYPVPYVRRIDAGDRTGMKDLLVAGVRAGSNDAVFELDGRLAKDVSVGRSTITLSLDAFNLTNNRAVLQRSHRLNNLTMFPNPSNGRVLEWQSPRLFRIGARLSF